MPSKRKRAPVAPPRPPPMQKCMRRAKTICSCSSARSAFCWYGMDVWTEIANYLDAKSLVMLATTCRCFRGLILEEGSMWKHVCLRDLQVPEPRHVALNWRKLYVSAFDGSHSYMFRQQKRHIVSKRNAQQALAPLKRRLSNHAPSNQTRIGAFSVESSEAFLTEKLIKPSRLPEGESIQKMLESCGSCVLDKVKTGIWIADLQLARCPVCELNTCDGTMQTLDELFLSEGYKNGSWDYELIGHHDVNEHANGACGAIFDMKHLEYSSTSAVFNLKSWVGKPTDWQPKAVITLHAVAVNANLQKNEGLQVKYHVMRAGPQGEVVSIRISQQHL